MSRRLWWAAGAGAGAALASALLARRAGRRGTARRAAPPARRRRRTPRWLRLLLFLWLLSEYLPAGAAPERAESPRRSSSAYGGPSAGAADGAWRATDLLWLAAGVLLLAAWATLPGREQGVLVGWSQLLLLGAVLCLAVLLALQVRHALAGRQQRRGGPRPVTPSADRPYAAHRASYPSTPPAAPVGQRLTP